MEHRRAQGIHRGLVGPAPSRANAKNDGFTSYSRLALTATSCPTMATTLSIGVFGFESAASIAFAVPPE
jgi:hypothetical protein